MTFLSKSSLIAALIALPMMAAAHEDVQNEAVKARMMLMKDIKAAMGTIGGMAKGAVAFNADQAAAAKAALVAAAPQIAIRFEAPETDPKSEARPEIWQNWPDFVQKADDFGAAAAGLQTASVDDLKAGLGAIGKTCGGCHKPYRVDK